METLPLPTYPEQERSAHAAASAASAGGFIVAPDGVRWSVRRRWFGDVHTSDAAERSAGPSLLHRAPTTVYDCTAPVIGVVLFTAIVAVVCVVIPLLLCGLALVIAGCLLACGLVGRLVLDRPWQIEATTLPGSGPVRTLHWEVTGRRRSAQVMERISVELAEGRYPQPGALRCDA